MMKHILPVVLMLSSLSAHATEQSPVPWENIPLGTDTFLTFNGSLRERYEWTDQRDLGLVEAGVMTHSCSVC